MTQAARLVRLAEDAVARQGLSMRYDGEGSLVPVGSDGAPVQDGMFAGLANLARTVSGLPRQQWRSAVAAHFDQLTADPPPIPDDLHSELYLRLVCASTIRSDWAERVPEFVPGVLTVPATYAGRAVAMHFDINNLGVPEDEATRMGLANLRRLQDDVEQLHYNGAKVTVLTGSMFTASRALVLDTVLRESLQVEKPFRWLPRRDAGPRHAARPCAQRPDGDHGPGHAGQTRHHDVQQPTRRRQPARVLRDKPRVATGD